MAKAAQHNSYGVWKSAAGLHGECMYWLGSWFYAIPQTFLVTRSSKAFFFTLHTTAAGINYYHLSSNSCKNFYLCPPNAIMAIEAQAPSPRRLPLTSVIILRPALNCFSSSWSRAFMGTPLPFVFLVIVTAAVVRAPALPAPSNRMNLF